MHTLNRYVYDKAVVYSGEGLMAAASARKSDILNHSNVKSQSCICDPLCCLSVEDPNIGTGGHRGRVVYIYLKCRLTNMVYDTPEIMKKNQNKTKTQIHTYITVMLTIA